GGAAGVVGGAFRPPDRRPCAGPAPRARGPAAAERPGRALPRRLRAGGGGRLLLLHPGLAARTGHRRGAGLAVRGGRPRGVLRALWRAAQQGAIGGGGVRGGGGGGAERSARLT